MTPTASRPPRWAQADLREPEIDSHDERAFLVLRFLAGAFGAGMAAVGLVALVAWTAGLL